MVNIITLSVIFAFLLFSLYHYAKNRNARLEIYLASIISLIWVTFYGYNYDGNQLFLLGRINVFAFVAWTLGLVIFAQVWKYFRANYSRVKMWIYSGVVYIVGLNVLEWYGYNVLKIQLSSSYEGLLGMNLIHGPWYMKAFYLTEWALFILVYEALEERK